MIKGSSAMGSSVARHLTRRQMCTARCPGRRQCMATPPLGLMSWPVRKLDASEARYNTQ